MRKTFDFIKKNKKTFTVIGIAVGVFVGYKVVKKVINKKSASSDALNAANVK